MAKKKDKLDVNVDVNEPIILDSFEPLNEKKVFTIILFASSKLVKVDTEKEVSGNIANILIKKGFAKLKTI